MVEPAAYSAQQAAPEEDVVVDAIRDGVSAVASATGFAKATSTCNVGMHIPIMCMPNATHVYSQCSQMNRRYNVCVRSSSRVCTHTVFGVHDT